MPAAGPSTRLRLIAVLGVAAWAVHQLRYALAFGSGQGDALRRSGHGYLEVAGPLIGLLLLLAAAQLVQAVARRRADDGRPPLALHRAWALFTLVLLGVFATQELLEGALSSGHPSGAAALLRDGGWLAGPLAAAAGLVSALVLREARAVTGAAPIRLRGVLRWVTVPPARSLTSLCVSAVTDGRGRHLAGRGPPAR